MHLSCGDYLAETSILIKCRNATYIHIHIFKYKCICIYLYTLVCVCSVHKHLRATVWTEMMSKLQASKWFINKQNQSTEATRPATVSPPPPFATTLPVCPEANWWPLCGRRKAVGGYQQHLIKTQITETSGQCKKLFLVYISLCVCECVGVFWKSAHFNNISGN